MIDYLKYRLNEFFYGGNKISISNDALVLDVASGGKPYWRSDVLMDKFVFDNSERDADLIIDRDFVVGDVVRLPFKDKAFDFVIARHILEHLPDPEVFLKELQRVGKAGYIETPSSFSESLFGWPFHLWEIDVVGGVLEIKTKNKTQNNQLKKISRYFDTDKDLKRFFFKNRNLFFTAFYWKDNIDFNIFKDGVLEKTVESEDVSLGNFNLKEYKSRFNLKARIKIFINKIRRMIFVKKRKYELVGLLSCIKCHGEIKIGVNSVLSCQECAKEYEYKDNIPVIL